MIRLGWMGDSPLSGSGFACVAKNVLSRLASTGRYEIYHLSYALNPNRELIRQGKIAEASGDVETAHRLTKFLVQMGNQQDTTAWDVEIPTGLPFRCIPVVGKPYGEDCLGRFIEKFGIEVMIINFDPWMTAWTVIDQPTRNTGASMVYYQPLDGACVGQFMPNAQIQTNPGSVKLLPWQVIMNEQHFTVLYNEWSRQYLLRNLEIYTDTKKVPIKTEVSVIPHGVDTSVYYPEDKTESRRVLSGFFIPPQQLPEDAFLVGMVATNQSRKDWPGLFEAFARFSQDKPNVYLLAWTSVFPSNQTGYDLHSLAEHMGIRNRVIFKGYDTDADGNIPPDDIVRVVYNCMDVYVQMHHGEGFGLPILEAQACGIPTLAVDHSGAIDLMFDDFQRIPVGYNQVQSGNVIERPFGSVKDTVQKMNRLYGSKALRKRLSRQSVEFAKTWSWDKTIPAWEGVVESAAAMRNERMAARGLLREGAVPAPNGSSWIPLQPEEQAQLEVLAA